MKQTAELSAEKLAELKKAASKILENCRTLMLERHPFVGSVAMSFNIYPIRDSRCETACTDGKAIYFDIDFLSKLSDGEREFVIAHEVWHNVMMHFLRTEGRDREIFNYATDMEINEILANDGFTVCKDCVRAKGFHLPDGLCAEEYYEALINQAKTAQKFGNMQSNERGNAKNNNGGGANSKQFDRHIYEGDEMEEGNQRTDRYGKVGNDPDFNPSIDKNAVEKVREAVISAAQQIERSRGELPGCIKKIVDSLLKPKVSWKELIAAQITSAMCDKTNWNLPNRRFAYNGVYLPSHCGEKIKIGIGVDTSGSCGEDFAQFIAEINSIAKTFGGYEIHVIQCDTEVTKYDLFDESNPMDFENNPIEFNGGGGTVLKPIFNYAALNELDVDSLIIFTDGYCEDFKEEDAPDTRVIWAITGGNNADNLKFGEKIKIDREVA